MALYGGLYGDTGKENGNHYIGFGVWRLRFGIQGSGKVGT